MGDSSEGSGNYGGVIELTGRIIVVAVIILFLVVVFLFCIHLFAKWYWISYRRRVSTTTRRRRRLNFAGQQEITVIRRGLEPSVLKALPAVAFDPQVFKDGLECAVCLSEVCDGENTRLLPKCNHGFHVECIDMWFQSHSTCPLCRSPVASEDQSSAGSETGLETTGENEGSNSNVISMDDHTRVSTLASSAVDENHQHGANAAEPSSSSSLSSSSIVIDIPRQVNEEEEQKSPVPTRLRTLKRLLSGNRRVNHSSPRNLDLEQGSSRVQS